MPLEYDDDDLDDEEDDEEEEEVVAKKSKKRGGGAGKKFKDPSKPKRAMSAFFLYSQAFRSQAKEDNPDASFGDIARLLSAQFKALPEKEKKRWEKKAEQDKIRYNEEMKHYVPMDDPDAPAGSGKGKRKKAKKDPNAPKRNMSAYFLYSNAIRSTVKEENPEATFGDIARLISEQFKTLAPKERALWDKKAEQDKERYQREIQEYNEGE